MLAHDQAILVQIVLVSAAGPATRTSHHTQDVFEISAEVLAVGRLWGLNDSTLVYSSYCFHNQGDAVLAIKHRWHATLIVDGAIGAGRSRGLPNQVAHQRIDVAPGPNVRGAQGTTNTAFRRNRIVRILGANGVKREYDVSMWVGASRQQAGQINNRFAQCVGNISCHLWTGGMPTRAMYPNLQRVGRRGDSVCLNTDVADTQFRFAVDGKNVPNVIEYIDSNNLGYTVNRGFLDRLENETQWRQQRVLSVVLGYNQCRRECDCGVEIMSAGMYDAVVGADEPQSRNFRYRKGIYVPMKGGTPWALAVYLIVGKFTFTSVSHQAGVGKRYWLQPCSMQLLLRKNRGSVFYVKQL